MNFLKISKDKIIYLNMDKVKTLCYDPDIKRISVCYNGENVIDRFYLNDDIKLQLENFGIFLK